MIRFSTQLWHNAVVAVTVAFATANVEAGFPGGLGNIGGGSASHAVKHAGGNAFNSLKQQTAQHANHATQKMQNIGQATTHTTQQMHTSTQNAMKPWGQAAHQIPSQSNRVLGNIPHQTNAAVKHATQPSQSVANQAKIVTKHSPVTHLPTTVPHQTIDQLPKSLPFTKPTVKSVPNVQSAINSTKQTLGHSAQVVKQDLSKTVNLRMPKLPTTVPKLPQRKPVATIPVIKGRSLPHKTLPKVGLPELSGASLPTLNPKVDAAKAVAATTLVVGTLNQVLNGTQAESSVAQPMQTDVLVTENGSAPISIPTIEDPSTVQAIDTLPAASSQVPVDPATAGLQLAGSIVDLVAAGVANQNLSSGNTSSYDASSVEPAIAASEFMETPASASSEVPTKLTFLIHNLTEQPLTYSIRAAGTPWGTYTLAAGKEHKYSVTDEEMEVRYTNSQGEQTVTVPGEHFYAFADVEGQVQLCNADPEDSETAAE